VDAASAATESQSRSTAYRQADLPSFVSQRGAPGPSSSTETPLRVKRRLAATSSAGEGRLELFSWAARILDVSFLVVAALAAWGLVGNVAMLPAGWLGGLVWTTAVVGLWYVSLEVSGAYARGRIGDTLHDLRAVARTSALMGASVAIFAYVTNWALSRTLFGVTFGLGLLLLLVSHLIVRRALQQAHARGQCMQRVVVVGSRQAISELNGELRRCSWVGLEVVAACVPDSEAWEPIDGVKWVFPVATLHDVVKDTDAQHVFLLHGAGESSRHLRRISWSLEGTSARLAVVPQMTDIAHGRIRPRPVAGLPLIELAQPQLTGPQTVLKRTLDVVGSLATLVVLSPVWAVVALLIKLEDGGPVLYRQTRVGVGEREFSCFKFRSMCPDADTRLCELEEHNEGNGVLFKIKDDPRVTRVGRFIRRHSIDELPQLINVLKGEMSMVGPRPPLPKEVAEYHADLTRRLKVRPGMTGLWQVSGRSELDADESERLDLYYVDNWSIWHDALILWRTLRVVVTGHGAY
jgi:exopolysaccharide biosynthesis polyprenyl glycosylphosphotransferase